MASFRAFLLEMDILQKTYTIQHTLLSSSIPFFKSIMDCNICIIKFALGFMAFGIQKSRVLGRQIADDVMSSLCNDRCDAAVHAAPRRNV